MPDSCAKALRPTIALLYCTGNEVAAATSFEARVSKVLSTLVQYGVAGALADAVDGALDLADAGAHAGERVRHRHAEVVVAMGGEARLVGVGHAVAYHLDQREIFLGNGVTDGVGDIDGGGA